MNNRMNIAPWPTFPMQQPPLVGTPHSFCADQTCEAADPARICESWRTWEAGTISEFLNWFLFTSHGTSAGKEPAFLEDWISFRDGSSELDDRARAILGRKLKLFRNHPAMRVVIGGLADQPGPTAPGMRLGLRRVLSIRTFLVEHGIEPGRIGIAVRGSGWSVTERSRATGDSRCKGRECRLQITDPLWMLARN